MHNHAAACIISITINELTAWCVAVSFYICKDAFLLLQLPYCVNDIVNKLAHAQNCSYKAKQFRLIGSPCSTMYEQGVSAF